MNLCCCQAELRPPPGAWRVKIACIKDTNMAPDLSPRAKPFSQREGRTFLPALQIGQAALEQEGVCPRPLEQAGMEGRSRRGRSRVSDRLHPLGYRAGTGGCASPPGELGNYGAAAPRFNACVGTSFWPLFYYLQYAPLARCKPGAPSNPSFPTQHCRAGRGDCDRKRLDGKGEEKKRELLETAAIKPFF